MLEILYQDQALVVCVKPFRVLSTDEPGGMPDLIRQAIGQPRPRCGRSTAWIRWWGD